MAPEVALMVARFSKAEVMRMLARNNPGALPKPRKRRFTGDHSQRKKWLAEMSCMPGMFFAMKVVTESNTGGHFMAKAERAKSQRTMLYVSTLGMIRRDGLKLPAKIQFTRYGPRTLDSDNIWSAFKHVRDGMAEAFGVDDKSDKYEWLPPVQVVSKHYGIRVEIEGAK